jgi:hypothetical protein
MGFENEGRVPDDDLFPIELLGLRAQESILAEFGGRRPSLSEVASISDDHLMKLSGFGPSNIRKVRSITHSVMSSIGANVNFKRGYVRLAMRFAREVFRQSEGTVSNFRIRDTRTLGAQETLPVTLTVSSAMTSTVAQVIHSATAISTPRTLKPMAMLTDKTMVLSSSSSR